MQGPTGAMALPVLTQLRARASALAQITACPRCLRRQQYDLRREEKEERARAIGRMVHGTSDDATKGATDGP